MNGTVRWKVNEPDSAPESREIQGLEEMARAFAEALNQRTSKIEIYADPTPLPLRSWSIVWGTKDGIGHCAVKSSQEHLTKAVDELLKKSPSEVSIAERKSSGNGDREPPDEIIAEALEDGQVVPFLGAGVPASARKPPGAEWSATARFPPTGAELSE
jgi:hypothetical protein